MAHTMQLDQRIRQIVELDDIQFDRSTTEPIFALIARRVGLQRERKGSVDLEKAFDMVGGT